MTEHPAKDCSEEAIAVFEQIAINNDRGHPQHLLDELIAKELIGETMITLTSNPPQIRYNYFVPLHHHMMWCQWCSEQPMLDDEEADLTFLDEK